MDFQFDFKKKNCNKTTINLKYKFVRVLQTDTANERGYELQNTTLQCLDCFSCDNDMVL